MEDQDLLSQGYRRLLETYHETYTKWGRKGSKQLRKLSGLMKMNECKTALNFGCGQGNLSKSLREMGFVVIDYDPGIPELASLPKEPVDCVFATDVMEHVEPDKVDLTLRCIQRLMKKVGFFDVCTRPARKIFPDGSNTHRTIRPNEWWLEKFEEYFECTRVKSSHEKARILIWVRKRI